MARESSSDPTRGSGRDAFRTPISRFIVSSGAERPRVEQEYEPGSTIANRYLVDKTLGVGGMCTVYLVGDKTRKDRPVALKLVAGETNSVRIETFRNEFRILSHLEHENLIRVFDFGVLGADGGFYYTAEYIDGKDLREAAAGVPEETLVDYIVQACRGLEYVHSRGYIHYDVKSGNILVTGDGVVKLTDFGLSALAGRGLGKRIRGTPAYTSPEIIMMADVDARADLYSLGVTLYEIVAGTQPFRTRDLHDLFHKHVAEAPTPPRSVNPDVPEYLEQIILRLLAKNPADRFGSANAVIAELARFVEGEIELQPASSVEGYLRTPPLCGREKEMNQAAFALGQLGKGSGRHVVIEGVKGIGRTRLLREIFYSAQIEGYAAVFGSGSEPGLFSSLADSLKSFPQIESLDHPGSEGGEDGRSVPEGAAAAKSALPDALARIIAASEQTPVVICIDDLQDADTSSQKAIKRLSQLLATSSAPPLLLITSYRNDGGSPGTYAPGVLRLSLGPLDRGEIGEAVSRMFGQARAPEIFVSRLADSTGGVPHAVVETVRMLVASGNITLVEGKWHFRGGVEPFEVPSSLDGFYASQVDALGGLLHGLALNLALLDRGASMTEISALHREPPKRIAAALSDLEKRGIISRREGRAVIANRGIRDALLNSRSPQTIKRRHGEIAEKLERLRDRGPGDLELARHFLFGGMNKKGLRYGVAAIDKEEVGNDRAALGLLERMREAAADAARPVRAGILFALARALGTENNPEETLEAIDEYRGTAPKKESAARRAQMERYAAECYGRLNRPEDAEASWKLALSLVKDEPVEYLRTLMAYEETLESRGLFDRCEELLIGSVDRVEGLNHYVGAEFWAALARIAIRQGRVDDVKERAEKALEVAIEVGAGENASLVNLLAVYYEVSGDAEEAESQFRRARQLAVEQNDMMRLASTDTNLARFCFQKGNTDEGIQFALEAESVFRRYADFEHLSFVYYFIGQETRQRAGCSVALDYFKKGLDSARAGQSRMMEFNLLSLLSDVTRQQGNYSAALRYADECDELVKRHGMPKTGGTACIRAGTYAQIGKISEGFEWADTALGIARTLDNELEVLIARYATSHVALVAGRFGFGLEHLDKILRAAGNVSQGNRFNFKLLAAEFYILLGQLRQVERIVDELESEMDAAASPLDRAALTMTAGRVKILRRQYHEAEEELRIANHLLNPDVSIHVYLQLLAASFELELYRGNSDAASKRLEKLKSVLDEMPDSSTYFLLQARLFEARLALLNGDRELAYRESMAGMHEARGAGYRPLQMELAKIAAGTSPDREESENLRESLEKLAEELSEGIDEEMRDSVRKHFLLPLDRFQAAERVSPDSEAAGEKTQALLQLAIFLARENDPQRAIDAVLDAAFQIFNVGRAFLLVREEEGLSFAGSRYAKGLTPEPPERQVSKSIIDRVIETGEPLFSERAGDDTVFAAFRSVIDLELLSVLAVPVRIGGEVKGCLYLDNAETPGAFGEEDKRHAVYLAGLTGSILDKQIALANLRETSESLQLQLDQQSAVLEVIRREFEEEKSGKQREAGLEAILGRSDVMRKLVSDLTGVASSNLPVLVTGESGTGKDLFAKVLHNISGRAGGRFITVNCGSIPESLFNSEFFGVERGAFTGADESKPGLMELADGGTIYLDEIADLPRQAQNALVRAVAEGSIRRVGGREPIPVNVWIVSSTAQDLGELVEQDLFRSDLMYKLNAVELKLPPLRERREDVPILAAFFLAEIAEKSDGRTKPLSLAAMEKIEKYVWPGNVRELQNVLERAYIISKRTIRPEHLSLEKPENIKFHLKIKTMEEMEREHILQTLKQLGGKIRQTAKALKIGRETLRRKLNKYKEEGFIPEED